MKRVKNCILLGLSRGVKTGLTLLLIGGLILGVIAFSDYQREQIRSKIMEENLQKILVGPSDLGYQLEHRPEGERPWQEPPMP